MRAITEKFSEEEFEELEKVKISLKLNWHDAIMHAFLRMRREVKKHGKN